MPMGSLPGLKEAQQADVLVVSVWQIDNITLLLTCEVADSSKVGTENSTFLKNYLYEMDEDTVREANFQF